MLVVLSATAGVDDDDVTPQLCFFLEMSVCRTGSHYLLGAFG